MANARESRQADWIRAGQQTNFARDIADQDMLRECRAATMMCRARDAVRAGMLA
jgi:hypothetical protein